VVPTTLLLIFVLFCVNFGRIAETLIVMLSLPFALIGGLWFVWWIGFNLSVALAVGFIALAGVAAETGAVMLIYADQALAVRQADCRREQRTLGRADLDGAIIEGAAERVRPKIMTVTSIVVGLVPILWNDGTGSEVMQRIAVPMIGGMASSILLTLLVIPAIYGLIKGRGRSRPSLRAPRRLSAIRGNSRILSCRLCSPSPSRHRGKSDDVTKKCSEWASLARIGRRQWCLYQPTPRMSFQASVW